MHKTTRERYTSSSFEELKTLGSGSYATAKLLRHKDNKNLVVGKFFQVSGSEKSKEQQIKNADREAKILSRILHKNIVQFLGTIIWEDKDNHFGMLLEYAPCEDLHTLLIINYEILLPWNVRSRFFLELSEALDYLHYHDSKRSYIHGDMKSENILLGPNLEIKLADFGAADVAKLTGASSSTIGSANTQHTPYYTAPEYLKDPTIDRDCSMDVYSYGMVGYEILTRKVVFDGFQVSSATLICLITDRGQKPNPKCLDDIATELKCNIKNLKLFRTLQDVVLQCWSTKSEDRPKISNVKQQLDILAKEQDIYDKETDATIFSLIDKKKLNFYTDITKHDSVVLSKEFHDPEQTQEPTLEKVISTTVHEEPFAVGMDFTENTIANLYKESLKTSFDLQHFSAVETEELELRDYQEELAQPGREGNSCIVLAPTGSGKTIVAVSICKQLIEKKKLPKVLFLVPRVPLVNQQFKVFQKYLGDIIFQVSGDKSSTVSSETHVFIEKHVMTVMTAQILYNLLQENLIKFESIDLIIFDECHHTMKKHIYNKIMCLYMNERFLQANLYLPQIVGLTASVSVGKAKSKQKAEESIKTLMANLDVIMPPVQVIKHIDSLNLHQNDANDELFTVTRHSDDDFALKIATAMHEMESVLLQLYQLYDSVLLKNKLQIEPPLRHGRQAYEEWVVHLLQKSTLIKHPEASQCFRAFAKLLRKYNDALIMNDHVRGTDVKLYLEDFLSDQPSNKITTLLQDVYRRNEPQPTEDTNPLLEKLKEILAEHYSKKPDSRCIIFVRTRPIANALINYLSEQPALFQFSFNAELLTGTNATFDNFGMTKAEQEYALHNFRSGNCKVLVSTSVAEEGLDIKACNLIITYNYATNEVGKVQRKGRGRAEDSRFIILSYSDSGIVPRERGNDLRVELANEALEKIRNMDSQDLESEIRKIQMKAKVCRDSDAQNKILLSLQNRSATLYKLRCKGCKTLITTSDNIRRVEVSHHVIVDASFPARATIYPVRPPFQVAPGVVVTGKIKCKDFECKENWGSCMNHKGLPIYVVKGNCFILSEGEEPDEKWCEVQRWSEVPFYNSIIQFEPQ